MISRINDTIGALVLAVLALCLVSLSMIVAFLSPDYSLRILERLGESLGK